MAPHPIIIAAAAAPNDLDNTLEYVINNSDAPEVAKNTVLVDAVVQTESLAAASPNPFRGMRIEGYFSAFINRQSVVPDFGANLLL